MEEQCEEEEEIYVVISCDHALSNIRWNLITKQVRFFASFRRLVSLMCTALANREEEDAATLYEFILLCIIVVNLPFQDGKSVWHGII